MITFRELLTEKLQNNSIDKMYTNDKDKFMEIMDLLSNYMDFSDITVIPKLAKAIRNTPLVTFKNKVYRVMCREIGKDIDLGTIEMISTSTKRLKGKVLDRVIGDMKDRYKYYKKMKDCEVVYIELSNVEGLDIENLINLALDKTSELNKIDKYYLDMFKRLKEEKEFLVFNNKLKISNIEVLD